MKSFAYFFSVFAFFIVSFGIGFYVIFNGESKDKLFVNAGSHSGGNATNKTKGEINYFGSSYLAVIKTSAMMIGELVSRYKFKIQFVDKIICPLSS